MTQKELLYFEDAIGHETNLIKICEQSINYLENEELISFMKEEVKRHKNLLEKLMDKLGSESYEWSTYYE